MGNSASCCDMCNGEARRKQERISIHNFQAPELQSVPASSEKSSEKKRKSIGLKPGIDVDRAYDKIRQEYQRNRKAFQYLYPNESQDTVQKTYGLDDERHHELMRIKRHLQAGQIYQLSRSRDSPDGKNAANKPADWVLCLKRGSMSGSKGGIYEADIRQIHNFSRGLQTHNDDNAKGLDEVGVARMKLSAREEELADLSQRQLYMRKYEERQRKARKNDALYPAL